MSEGAGRPTVITPEVLRILEDAFLDGATDIQACFLAKISKTALYDYQKDNPEFTERKEALKADLAYQAKKNIAKNIRAGDLVTSTWLLPKAEKETYSDRKEVTGANGKDIVPTDEAVKEKVDKAINEYLNPKNSA